MTKYIIVYGDPIGGFHYVGPFDTSDREATKYGDRFLDNEFFWVVALEEPEIEEPDEYPSRESREDEKYRQDMKDAGRGHLLKD